MKLTKAQCFFLSLFFTLSSNVLGQFSIVIIGDSTQQRFVFSDRKLQQNALSEIVTPLLKSNYAPLDLTNDTISSTESILKIGKPIQFKIAIADSILKNIGATNFTIKPYITSYQDIKTIAQKTIAYYENRGYPFVTVNPQPTFIDSSHILMSLSVDLGPEIYYDSIDIKGSSRISNRFINGYLGLKKGKIYNEKEIQLIEKKISKLSFLQSEKHPQLAFIEHKLRLILYLNKKNNSQFDGIIGLLPQSGENSKTLITGDVKLNLKNTFNNAEQIELNWRRSDPLSQDLIIGSTIPYILGSKYGAKINFKLNKRDTTTLTSTTKIGGNYYFSGMNNITAYFEISSSKILSTPSINNLENTNKNLDYSINRYGIALELDYLNDIWIPTRGVKMNVDVNIGTRKTVINSKIPADYYANIAKTETQIKAISNIEVYFPIFKKIIVAVSQKNFYLSGNKRYENELFRFGGLTTLRGFNEESIHASTASIINTEIRWLVDRATYLFVFWNGAYYEKRTPDKFTHDTPNGTGIGLSFDTPAGIFNITYALGKEFSNPIQIKFAKIHFGIVARF